MRLVYSLSGSFVGKKILCNTDYKVRCNNAENSTQEKNQVIKDLRAWYGEFRKLARIAFKDNPQVLESFGMVVSTQRKKKVESPVKE
ncbi:hypothetical protein WJR50_16085 [Catalinimonas sp. 4WD22]|uniref:hypothetical protein n=1 Tax=Catalinimonas locisalis TaxID=3133978 RepID=UPI0031012A80